MAMTMTRGTDHDCSYHGAGYRNNNTMMFADTSASSSGASADVVNSSSLGVFGATNGFMDLDVVEPTPLLGVTASFGGSGGGGGGGGFCSNGGCGSGSSSSWFGFFSDGDRDYSTQRRQKSRAAVETSSSSSSNLDAQLAKGLSELSVNERNVLFEEMNGIVTVVDENPLFIGERLKQLDEELTKTLERGQYNTRVEAYRMALSQNPEYVCNKKFRLMFLRGFKYDAVKASKHMIIHFEWKLKLFGSELLTKDITLDDLNDDDMFALKKASILFLPGKDRAGRKVFMMVDKHIEYKTWISQLRVILYQFMSILQDEDVQRKGIAVIPYIVSSDNDTPPSGKYFNDIIQLPSFGEALPIHKSVFHFCYNNPTFRTFLGLLHQASSKEEQTRFKFHFGSHQECHYELLSVGIHESMLLVDSAGRLRTYMGQRYIEDQIQKEKEWLQQQQPQLELIPVQQHAVVPASSSTWSSSSSVPIAVGTLVRNVTSNDILLGRGKKYQNHIGNIRLNKLLESYYNEYSSIQRSDWNFVQAKADIVNKIVTTIQNEYGGRFLKQQQQQGGDELWVVVDNEIAKNKIAYGFRTITKMRRIVDDNKADVVEGDSSQKSYNDQHHEAKRLKIAMI